MTEAEFRRTFSFGKIAAWRTRRINAVEVEVCLRKRTKVGGMTIDGEPCENYIEFSASGSIWNGSHSDIVWGGQCLEDIAEHIGQLTDPATFRRILALWRRWHLNGMRSGTREQHAALEKAKAESIAAFAAASYTVEGEGGYGYRNDESKYASGYYLGTNFYAWAGFKSYYEWECEALRRIDLYEVPFGPEQTDCGLANCWTHGLVRPPVPCPNPPRGMYKFGSAWLIDPIPADDWQEILDLLGDTEPAKERLAAWLAEGD